MSPSEFCKKVVSAYEKRLGIFSNLVNAEDHIPNNASDLEKALFLFYVIQLDYATKSQKLYEGAKRLYSEDKNYFSPSFILKTKEKDLLKVLQDYLKPRYINEATKRFYLNSEKIEKQYEADPREIFKGSKTAKEALIKVREFRGFGPKIGNFFVRSMINSFGYEYIDIEDILPPVDVHDVRIAYLMGYTDSNQMTQKNIRDVKEVWSEGCKKGKVSWLVFDKALWLLGSEGKPKTKQDILNLVGLPGIEPGTSPM